MDVDGLSLKSLFSASLIWQLDRKIRLHLNPSGFPPEGFFMRLWVFTLWPIFGQSLAILWGLSLGVFLWPFSGGFWGGFWGFLGVAATLGHLISLAILWPFFEGLSLANLWGVFLQCFAN